MIYNIDRSDKNNQIYLFRIYYHNAPHNWLTQPQFNFQQVKFD